MVGADCDVEDRDVGRDPLDYTTKCGHCGDGPTAWRCTCGFVLCGDCLFSQIDCYDLARRCPGCGLVLPDSDGGGPVDWPALGYRPEGH